MTVTFAQLGNYGRCGNQLWQCAATIGYSIKYNCDYIFPRWEYEDDFNIPKEKFFDKINFNQTFNESNFHYAGIPHSLNLNLMGYFQSYKYFQDEDHIISPLLSPKYQADKRDVTSIHVRRTDYLTHTGCYNILSMENYYEKAIEIAGGDKFLVFSDDIPWCKRHFIGNQYEFSEGNGVTKDLALMIKCKRNIIANSSFSWWGAWLNKQSEKVIAPATWFGPKLAPTHDTKDLVPKGWIKV